MLKTNKTKVILTFFFVSTLVFSIEKYAKLIGKVKTTFTIDEDYANKRRKERDTDHYKTCA